MNKITSPKKIKRIRNSPISLSLIIHSFLFNVKNLLIGEAPFDPKELKKQQNLASDEELGLPSDGIFSPEFNEILKEIMDKK